jgi:hypothetical protein
LEQVNRIHDMTLTHSDTNWKEALECGVTHAVAPAEIHCIVCALRYADERHTAPSPLLRRHGRPAPSGSGFRGSEARPLHKDRAD